MSKLINFIDQEAVDSKNINQGHMHDWFRKQMDMVGGWLPEMDEAYRPLFPGYYAFDAETWSKLNQAGLQVASYYDELGRGIRKDFLSVDLDEFWSKYGNLGIPDSYKEVFELLRTDYQTCSLMRPDILIDEDGTPMVVEVNLDNPAGIEDYFLFTDYFSSHKDYLSPVELMHVTGQRKKFLNMISAWVKSTYRDFLASQKHNGAPSRNPSPTIAVVYADRDDSFFTAKYMTAIFKLLGYEAIHCRPEHLEFTGSNLQVREPLSKAQKNIDVVHRDFLFEEMFCEKNSRYAFDDNFRSLLDAISNSSVVLLNPLQNFLLRSKSMLSQTNGLLWGTGAELLEGYVPETTCASDFNVASRELSEFVLKPAIGRGGNGVRTEASEIAEFLERPSESKRLGNYVLQKRVAKEKRRTRVWSDSGELHPQVLNCDHGLVMLKAHDNWEAGCVVTKAGASSVVSFSTGAQLVPGVVFDEN